MKKRTALISKVYYLTALIVITLMVIPISGCASEPEKQDALTRLDDDGYLMQLIAASAAGISMTQYSAIYNNEKKTVEV